MSANLSKNDIAWQVLFREENILDNIEKEGCFYISSTRINEEREARLMTKFDHKVQLPRLFRDNNLSIQPVSRGGYVIGNFSSYFQLPEDETLSRNAEVRYLELPSHIETINFKNISSESSAVLCAYLAEMLTDILEEETHFTVFGRMSTGAFDYRIENSKTGKYHSIRVENSQCEIDGGFEGESKFAIIEAKCQSADDFIVRQLYYPYRLWKSKLRKEVIPIFLSFSNNIFTFYIFYFSDLYKYNSLELKSVRKYCIGQYEIELSDIRQILNDIESFKDDSLLTFPQANKFTRVVDLLDKLHLQEAPLTKDEITAQYAFNIRQTDYYISAGVYLGLFERISGAGYALSNQGETVVELDPKRKNLSLVEAILSHKVFNLVLNEYLTSSEKPTRQRVIDIMRNNLDGLNPTTISRRAQTVERWVDWILQLTSA